MNSFEQILIRVGVDAKAVVTGLTKTTSYVKGWATNLAHEMKSSTGRLLGGFLLFEAVKREIEGIKEQILEVKRLSEETGASSNFIQSLMLEAKISGTSVEALTMPLIHFNRLIGDAKQGIPQAIIQLKDMGVITNKNEIGTLNYTKAMHNLAVAYDHVGDRAKKDALLQDAFGRSAFRLSPIFNKGAAGVDKMNEGNFATKISGGAISDFTQVYSAFKTVGQIATSLVANIIDLPLKGVKNISQFIGAIAGGARNAKQIKKVLMQQDEMEKDEAFQKGLANQASEEGITVEQEKARILTQQNDLLEKQKELGAEITDRNKMTIAEMAAHARKLMGIPEPRNYTVSARDKEALRIDTLEKRASIAFEKGDDKGFQSLTSEALTARKGFAGGKLSDVNPLGRAEVELVKVNEQLAPVQRMATLVLDEHKKPQ